MCLEPGDVWRLADRPGNPPSHTDTSRKMAAKKEKKEKKAFVRRGNLPDNPSLKTETPSYALGTPPHPPAPKGGVNKHTHTHSEQVLTALVWAWWAGEGPLCRGAGSAGPGLAGSPVPPGLDC